MTGKIALFIDHRRAQITGKGNKARTVAFDPLIADAINEWMRVRDPFLSLFYNTKTGAMLTSSDVRNIIRRRAAFAGITERHNAHG